ncbi:hypothetical protein C8R41DRAFT_924908 [Lentinula lateritia]|uniref:Sulfhydryl oxidase n=1 Tax=Lentinula lateritia TaxID=40482 RepID=A0ABQ8V335_9AGAR|nr:hypothetical protein C8R41DRAFT_924908 [Lentinula lateritia]
MPYPVVSYPSKISSINYSSGDTMMQNIVPEFFRLVNRQPPVIDRRCPLGPEVLRMLDTLQCFTRHLSQISSFQTRYDIVASNWQQIWSWLKALLHPVITDAQLDPHHLDTSRCVLTVFSFLNSVIPPSTPIVGLQKFVLELFHSPDTITILGKIWVFFFMLEWPSSVHQATTQFLVVFSRIIDCTPCENDFRTAIYNACSSSCLPTWSAATLGRTAFGSDNFIVPATSCTSRGRQNIDAGMSPVALMCRNVAPPTLSLSSSLLIHPFSREISLAAHSGGPELGSQGAGCKFGVPVGQCVSLDEFTGVA